MNSSPVYRPDRQIDRASWLVKRVTPRGAAARQIVSLVLFGLALVGILIAALYLTWETNALTLKAGQIADRTIKAPRTATFVSQTKTKELQQEAYDDARNVVFTTDPTIDSTQINAQRQAIQSIDSIRTNLQTSQSSILATPTIDQSSVNQVRAAVEGLTANQASAILSLSNSSWQSVKSSASSLLSSSLSQKIQSSDVASVKSNLTEHTSSGLSYAERQTVVALTQPFVRSNVQIDEDKTKAARQKAADAVEPVQVTVQQGQVIVRDGDPVTSDIIEKLEYFQLLTPTSTWHQFAGIAGLLALLTLALGIYLYRVPAGLWQGRQLVLIGLALAVPIVAGRFFLTHADLRYMFPTAAAIMLLAILLDFQVAVLASAFVALYIGVIGGASYEIAFVTFVACLAGAAMISRAERTVTFLWAGAGVAVFTIAASILITLVDGGLSLREAGSLVLDGGINGALSASVTFLSFSLLGRLFGITTHLQLLELAHPNQPLLYRLAREAPGTYHHSILVSNLAESAVEVVGGDPLFARVSVLYHDIGKVLRPSFFVENQANRANVHDALDPHTSARIIKEHVSDGVRLAKKARLPKPIVDIIQQHHGTTLIKYFYMQALKAGEEVDESEFRYAGPKPQTREAGIIMLADGVEAAVRSASQSGRLYQDAKPVNGKVSTSNDRLVETVDSVIKERLEDGQLDECDLTLRQVEQVRQAFIGMLEGIYHPRIEYPSAAEPTRPEVATVATPVQPPTKPVSTHVETP